MSEHWKAWPIRKIAQSLTPCRVCGGEIGPIRGGSSDDPEALGCYRCLSHWPSEAWRVPEDKREPFIAEDYWQGLMP